MLDVEAILRPYFDCLCDDVGGLELFDAHTHIGANDPDGFRQTPEELIAVLDGAGARAVVFPMHEPDGYRGPNDVAIDAAVGSGGKLVAYVGADDYNIGLATARHLLKQMGAKGNVVILEGVKGSLTNTDRVRGSTTP